MYSIIIVFGNVIQPFAGCESNVADIGRMNEHSPNRLLGGKTVNDIFHAHDTGSHQYIILDLIHIARANDVMIAKLIKVVGGCICIVLSFKNT